jgi:hypothetical protein
MAGDAQAEAARSSPVVSHFVFERLADQLGHRRAAFGCHLAQARDEVLGADDGGAANDIIMAPAP